MPWSIDTEFAPDTVHESTAAPPLEIDAGDASKCVIEGASFCRRSASAEAVSAAESFEDWVADPPPHATRPLKANAMTMKMPRFLSIAVVVLSPVFRARRPASRCHTITG
jgi:hypothetical protein